MRKTMLLIPVLLGMTLSGCSMINDTMSALENNRMAVDMSTAAIQENIQAIEEANRGIAENRRQLEAINATLKKVGE